MSLYIVVKRNPYALKGGVLLERDDAGYQKVETRTVGSRVEIIRNVGFIMPHKELDPYVMKVQQKGLDK